MSTEGQYIETLDLIVTAALEPTVWMDVLKHLAKITDCVAGGVTIEDAQTRTGEPLVYFGFDEDHVRRTFDQFLPMNPLFDIAPRMQPGFIVSNSDVVELSQFRRSEFYDGWARPQGICCPVTVVLHRQDATYCPLTLVRPDGSGDVTAPSRALLSRLAPHLTRAMGTTLALEKQAIGKHCTDTVLSACDIAFVALNGAGKICLSTPAAEALLRDGFEIRMRNGRLEVVQRAVDAALQAAIKEALAGRGGGVDICLPRDGAAALLMTVLPLRDRSRNGQIGHSARCIVLLQDAEQDRVGRVGFVSSAYKLTPGERRVLHAIMTGDGIAAAAALIDVSASTAKTHLQNIFAKTGTSRQGELINFVLTSPTTRARDGR